MYPAHDPVFGRLLNIFLVLHHRRTVARKFSIGGLCSSVGGLRFCGGLHIIKLTKTPLIYSVSRFNLGGLELSLGGLSPPKPPSDDGTASPSNAPLKTGNDVCYDNVSTAKVLANLPYQLLKSCIMSLATPFSLLFNFILATNRYSRSWKIASVIPLHKSGPTYYISNYRPIAILPSVSKVFENIIHNHLYTYLESNDLLFSRNSCFRKHHSTTSNLLEVSHGLLHAKDNGYSSRVVFLDISKAFDKVVHSGLLLKLQQLGVSGSFFNLMESYLLGRSQFVQISNAKSDILHTNCGVPQGSILGPLLFQVHVNDISKNIKSSISLFADDTVLPYSSKCPYNLHRILSSDLKTSQSWADL